MALTPREVERFKAMNRDELLASAGSSDFAAIVEASSRLRHAIVQLHRATIFLNVVLILLTGALVWLSYVLVYHAPK
jgi:hypothetical protein